MTSAIDPEIDFGDDLAQNVKAGTTIGDILALDEAHKRNCGQGVTTVEDLMPKTAKIGTIATEPDFIASKHGDYRLFFKHADKFIRPELAQCGGRPPSRDRQSAVAEPLGTSGPLGRVFVHRWNYLLAARVCLNQS